MEDHDTNTSGNNNQYTLTSILKMMREKVKVGNVQGLLSTTTKVVRIVVTLLIFVYEVF